MTETPRENELDELRSIVRQQEHYILRAQDITIGLEHEVATARAGTNREPLVAELAAIKASFSYRLGKTLTAPFRFLNKAFSFGLRTARGAARRVRSGLHSRKA